MSIFEKLFRKKKSSEQEIDSRFEDNPQLELDPNIKKIFDKGWEYYPNGDNNKAWELFYSGLQLVDDAPDDIEIQENIDLYDIGDAAWAAWVCMDLLNKPQNEINDYLKFVKTKTPVTYNRIMDRINESKVEQDLENKISILESKLINNPDMVSDERIKLIKELTQICEQESAWWELRDIAVELTKKERFNEAWTLFNSAVYIATQKDGNLPSIYLAMGDMRKREGNHHDAARLYLICCATSGGEPLKRAIDQLRISLKKSGLKKNAAEVRDELINLIGKLNTSELIKKLDEFIENAD